MKLTQKFSDFLKLEDAQGHLPKLAGMGVAVASSIAVSMLAPTVASACVHGDFYANYGHSDVTCRDGYCTWSDTYTNKYVVCG